MQTNWEVEQKYIVHDVAALRCRLSDIGFTHQHSEDHCDVYFRHPCRDFQKTDEAFRLRQSNGKTFVTYKGKQLEGMVKTRREIELGVVDDDITQWTELLCCLGFEPLPAVRKKRQVFMPRQDQQDYVGFVVTIDSVESLGQFSEIELIADGSSGIEDAQRRIVRVGTALGLSEVETQSYLALVLGERGTSAP